MIAVHAVRCLVTAGLLALLATRAQAGAMSPCSDPVVFDSRVQVHIFPFMVETELTEKGRALATLLQRHVLFAALKYPSIGVSELIDDDRPCNPAQVAGRISSRLKTAQTAIFLTGRIFEQDGRIYLKNYVRVKMPEDKRTLNWALAAEPQATSATAIPLEIDGFAPRTIPVSFLERLEPRSSWREGSTRSPTSSHPSPNYPTEPAVAIPSWSSKDVMTGCAFASCPSASRAGCLRMHWPVARNSRANSRAVFRRCAGGVFLHRRKFRSGSSAGRAESWILRAVSERHGRARGA